MQFCLQKHEKNVKNHAFSAKNMRVKANSANSVNEVNSAKLCKKIANSAKFRDRGIPE